MSSVGQIEKKTQERVLALLSQRLGYTYLGDWIDRSANSNIEPERLKASTKRPDVVLYVNGIALGALELKRSTVSVSEGIRRREGGIIWHTQGSGKSLTMVWLAMRGIASLDLFVRPGASQAQRAAVLDRWYREQLKALVTPMFTTWQAKLGVQASAWGVKRMKTKWGSCTPASRRVWLNSELAKKPVECIEYIVVHELLHLAEPNHGERFVALMNRHLPRWAAMQKRLNAAPLGHEEWAVSGLAARPPGRLSLDNVAACIAARHSPGDAIFRVAPVRLALAGGC